MRKSLSIWIGLKALNGLANVKTEIFRVCDFISVKKEFFFLQISIGARKFKMAKSELKI